MKLLKISVTNINSLYGDHEVDIEGALGAAPIFLIVGPTGAGKSSLMDAISLALFGQTPRLPKAKTEAEPDADARNVMSRGTGVAQAQVEFSKLEDGVPVRYRATWRCARARERADGNPQAPRRILARRDPRTGEWEELVSSPQPKVYAEFFDAVLEGLTVEDFKRSMLLAQGEFAAFLKATEDERASILERLTDTGIFKTLGQRAAERCRTATEALKAARAAVGGVELLPDAEEAALRARAAELGDEVTRRREEAELLSAVQVWRERLAALEAQAAAEAARAAEAEAALREAGPELSRLEEHERCVGAAPLLAETDRLGEELRRLGEALPELREHERACGEAASVAQAEAVRCELQVTEADAALAAASPELARARALRQSLGAAEAEARRAEGLEAEAQKADAAAREKQARATVELTEASEAHAGAEAAEASLAEVRPLVEALTGLRERRRAVDGAREAAQERVARAAAAAEAVARDEAALAELEKKLEGLTRDAAAADARLGEGEAALGAALQGAADAAGFRRTLRQAQERLAGQRAAVEQARRLWGEREAVAEKVSRLTAALEAHRVAAETAEAERASVVKELTERETEAAAWRTELESQRWMQEMARQRPRLEPGADCPLCGGTEHPGLHDGRFAELDARVAASCARLETQLERVGRQVEALTERRRALELASAQREERVRSEAQLLAEARQTEERVSHELREAAARACAEAPVPDALEAAAQAAASEEASLAARETALEAAERAAVSARDAAARARAECDRHGALREGRERALEAQRRALGEAEADRQRAAEALAAAEEVLAAELRAHGLDVSGGPDAALAEAARRVEALRAAEAARTRATERLKKAELAAAEAASRAEAAALALAGAKDTLQARREEVAALRPQCEAALGGEAPDTVEQRLVAARRAAEVARDAAVKRANAVAADHARAQTERAAREAQLASRTKEREEAEARLQKALRGLGLADVAALRARLLSETERVERVALRSRLQRAAEGTRAVVERRRAELSAHRESPPPGEAAWRDAAALAERRAALQGELDALLKEAGGLAERLAAQDRARAQHGERQAALEAAQREWELWERVHRLIGTRDGDAFKRFAQTLNLAELMDRANVHLERLAPRYRLVGATTAEGESRLAFAVKDAFQADTVRPINTLSGGETFLVSLSLALALAGYRTVKMPIETLLLDEGFGTLDPQTLQVVMDALEALNATGTQVGIISHVEALKERIPARVLVERAGNGRSTVRVEAA